MQLSGYLDGSQIAVRDEMQRQTVVDIEGMRWRSGSGHGAREKIAAAREQA
jgi:hypothetical protein